MWLLVALRPKSQILTMAKEAVHGHPCDSLQHHPLPQPHAVLGSSWGGLLSYPLSFTCAFARLVPSLLVSYLLSCVLGLTQDLAPERNKGTGCILLE